MEYRYCTNDSLFHDYDVLSSCVQSEEFNDTCYIDDALQRLDDIKEEVLLRYRLLVEACREVCQPTI